MPPRWFPPDADWPGMKIRLSEGGFDAMGYDAITLPESYRESPIAPRHILESFSYRFLDRLDR